MRLIEETIERSERLERSDRWIADMMLHDYSQQSPGLISAQSIPSLTACSQVTLTNALPILVKLSATQHNTVIVVIGDIVA